MKQVPLPFEIMRLCFFSLAKDQSTYLTKMKTFNLRIQNWSACQKLVSGNHRWCLPKSGLNKSLCFFCFGFCCCFSFFLVHRTENSISLEAKLHLQPKLFPTHAQPQFRLKENFCSLQRRHGALESSQSLTVEWETFWSLFLSSELTHLPPSTGSFLWHYLKCQDWAQRFLPKYFPSRTPQWRLETISPT